MPKFKCDILSNFQTIWDRDKNSCQSVFMIKQNFSTSENAGEVRYVFPDDLIKEAEKLGVVFNN